MAVTIGALVIGGLLTVGSYFGGDQLVLASSGAKEVDPTSAPQLMNVVQEMAIAAGVPMPKVYVIDDSAPNAFATGRDPKHASVAITSGLLQKLDREELQGVLGHEMSHVRNFDIRFGLLVAVLVGSIALLADMFLRFTWFGGGRSRNDRNGGGAAAIVFILAIVLAILAPIFARLVQLAVSRQREYLADASSVELTRNPHGIERALAKIAADQEVLESANRATAHLYFTNPIKKFESRASGMFSTHPPIVDRINRLRQLTGDPPLAEADVRALAGLD
jgi:heat shock protein HtpX